VSVAQIYKGVVLLIDCEFTCWEGSLASGWSDAARPAEIIEIAAIAYDSVERTQIARFSSLSRPELNPKLSDYSLNLLPITQSEIDDAPDFKTVVSSLESWLEKHAEPDSPTVGWGSFDRSFVALHAERTGVSDPFVGRSHVIIDELLKKFLELDPATTVGRGDIRKRLGIAPISDRHRAISDAEDLISFDHAMSELN
jgi:inhibitor of KinA sporulation pathway (predicted exonuclease)